MIENSFYIGVACQMDGVGVGCAAEKGDSILLNHLWSYKQANIRLVAENLKMIVNDIVNGKLLYEETNNLKPQRMFAEMNVTTNSAIIKKLNLDALSSETLIDFCWNVGKLRIVETDAITLATSCINEGRLIASENMVKDLKGFSESVLFTDKEKIPPLSMTLAMSVGVLEYQKLSKYSERINYESN